MEAVKTIMKNLEITTVITSEEIRQHYFSDSLFDVVVNEDVRSATFFSYGKAQREGRMMALVVYEEQLVHCYSAMTEAMFQHVSFLIFVLHKDNDSFTHDYLNACLIAEYNFDPLVEIEIKRLPVNKRGPIIVNVQLGKQPREVNVPLDMLPLIETLSLEHDDVVICFDKYSKGLEDYCRVITFSEGQKYGVISKYIGFLIGCSKCCILIMSLKHFKYDLNILNNRYINNRFKVIMVDEYGTDSRHVNWIKKNSISYSEAELSDSEKIKNTIQSALPEICILNVGR